VISQTTLNRLKLISQRTTVMNDSPRTIPKDQREEVALMMAVTLKDFREFAYLGMKFLGFNLTDMQADIAEYMQKGPRKRMVAAQRGEAKTTLAALYATWRLIQDQTCRVLIVSAGEKQSSDTAVLIIRLIETWPLLCYLRADSTRGDRTSYEGYDVHCDLKPLDRSASVACVGITASLQGKRADLLIPDDIESSKNGMTQSQREILLALSKDFAAICTHGDTLYLGTPQTKDSIYKTLPGRGFEVRVWPGRIPNAEMRERYGETLAPYIQTLIDAGYKETGFGLDGTLGECTDKGRYNEEALIEKELDFGPEGFQLQYMLDTTMSDALRTKIKLSDMLVYSGSHDSAPDRLSYIADKRYLFAEEHEGIRGQLLYQPASYGEHMLPYQHKLMVIDPAGCGGDEVSYACGGAANSYIHLFSVGGFQGGISTENVDKLIDLAIEMGISDIFIESNMGHGTVEMLFQNRLKERRLPGIGVRGGYNTSQKEKRIIDTISPVTRRYRFVVHSRALTDDIQSCMQYSRDKRWLYSAFQQLQGITYDRGSLAKDDRADAVAMLTAELNGFLVEDEKVVAEKEIKKKALEFMANPMGWTDVDVRPKRRNTESRLGRY
jgi:hypothetical protein